MKEVEIYQKRQGRPYKPLVSPMDTTGYGSSTTFTEANMGNVYRSIYYHHGNIDGGDIDGCSEAMDLLDIDLDGGTL